MMSLRMLGWAIAAVCLAPAILLQAEEAASPRSVEWFEKQVRPILAEHCYECHGPDKQRGGLRVDSREFLLKGTDNGPALVPEKPDESHLIEAIRYGGEVKMPPKAKLPQPLIDILTEWVKHGAVWPADAPSRRGPDADPLAWKSHWAFQPVKKPAIPKVKQEQWLRQTLDSFVLQKLEAAGLSTSPEADRHTWLRRAYFDVIGLPPTYEEVVAFQNDTSATAYETVIERLLSSPHYGERWGRHWLDVARYADTKGYVFQEDRNYPKAYTYRDWVVEALNRDLPYDQFLLRQLAADQLVTDENKTDLAAMGFLTLGRRFLNNSHDIIDDRIDVVMRGTMGLTVNCARCHDHKFDPIPTQDYYSLYGIFNSSIEPKDGDYPLRMVDGPNPHNIQVFVRGNPGNRGAEAPRRFLLCVAGEQRQPFKQGSGRLELAQSIVAPENPLTARVFVNRVWAHYFGAGLVLTPSDFGVRSNPPTHPELLDELAAQFMADGWSMKKLHRSILLSATYRQSSSDRPDCQAKDPENRLVWKVNRKRLEFEGLRDNLLAVSGRLDPSLGGAAVVLTAEPFPRRRTIYGFIDRQNLPGLFRVFDLASPDQHAPLRFSTTVPQQSLYMLNSPFLMELVGQLTTRPELIAISDPERKIEQLYRWVYSRQPTERELTLSTEFIKQSLEKQPAEIAIVSPWQYGYGEFDSKQNRIVHFQPLSKWTGQNWQGGDQLPDPVVGWAMLHGGGGHPGDSLKHAAIRRWLAPRNGTLTIEGRLRHRSDEGDGVLCRIVSNRSGVAGEWTVQHSETDTRVDSLTVEAGDQIDFYTDCRSAPTHDSFLWKVELKLTSTPPAEGGSKTAWNSQTDFGGPTNNQLLNPWERLAQVLLMSNEFVFID